MKNKPLLPPRWIIRFFEWICPVEMQEAALGDFQEQYSQDLTTRSRIRANTRFLINCLKFIKPYLFRRRIRNQARYSLIANYFVIGIRNLRRQWLYSLINISGLAIALICSSIITLYVYHELSYDNFHFDSKNTFRIAGARNNQTSFPTLSTPYSNRVMLKEYSGIRKVARFRRTKPKFITNNTSKVEAGIVFMTDPGTEFFQVFDIEFIYGDSTVALKKQNDAVITEDLASRLFGNDSPLNKFVEYDSVFVRITGVIKNIPSNSHMDFNMLVANAQGIEQSSGIFTYVMLKPGSLQGFEDYLEDLPVPEDEFRTMATFQLQPLQDIHLNSDLTYELEPPGSSLYLSIFSTIQIIILLIACTNYMNLSIAFYSGRRMEIAVRKILGGNNGGLGFQFMIESILVSLISFSIALILLFPTIDIIRNLTGIELNVQQVFNPAFLTILISIVFFAALISGSYPAYVLPRFRIQKLLREKSLAGYSGVFLRRLLVIIQFTMLIALAIASSFVNKQLNFIKHTDLGFDSESVLKITTAWDLGEWKNYIAFKNKLLTHSDISFVTNGLAPGDEDYGTPYALDSSDIVRNDLISIGVDLDYFETLQIEGVSGNFWNLTSEEKADKTVLINETFARQLGAESAIGREITYYPGTPAERTVTIGGVFKDFNYMSLHSKVGPMAISAYRNREWTDQSILIRVRNENLPSTIGYIEKTWSEIAPGEPIKLGFMSDDLDKFYAKEEALGNFSLILSIIAMLLATIGLIGLSSYMASLRIKEIGIRKILGATVIGIMNLLSKELFILVGVAFVLATGISYYFVSTWLENFSFQIEITWWVFPLIGLLALILGLGAMSFQSLKAAQINPVESLRSE